MAKNIVICCDGTGQRLDVHTTNVVRLFNVLDRADPHRLRIGEGESPMAKQRVPSGWRIEGTLGEGGQAQVFKVRRESGPTGPSFAYKLLRKNKGGEKAFQRFRQEIATLQKIEPSWNRQSDRLVQG